ncbi:Transcription factor, partial [Globisporangium splendens]
MRPKPRGATANGASAEGPVTPAVIRVSERSIHHPSPNRTEAAAAMMHLFTSSTVDNANPSAKATKIPRDAMGKNGKLKRRYVRKVPRKLDTSSGSVVKKAIKPKKSDAKDEHAVNDDGQEQSTVKSASGTEKEEPDGASGEWKMSGDEIKYFPFREYNRKEKSLGLLCENFLKLYRSNHMSEICLDRAASELGVERRRIYDIVNILESIHLVSRKSKNLYNWHGLSALPVSITAMKEHCIIPLDQAAKQLIQMEESENEEDRLLKTKIRRLYDVANVLVSVGLIEKLQLSNSRKPVFRWRNRTAAELQQGLELAEREHAFQVKQEIQQLQQQPSSEDVTIKSESPSSIDLECQEDVDAMKTSQSCDESDSFDDGSDSQSDSSSSSKQKRKYTKSAAVSPASSEDDVAVKRTKTNPDPTATSALTPAPSESSTSPQTAAAASSPVSRMLRFDGNNLPVHPQIILHEQQEQVRVYMQQYIREYVDYLIVQQVRPDPNTGAAHATAGEVEMESSVATITQDIHSTPVSMPSLTNRVTSDLAGSIHDLLFSTNTTSPHAFLRSMLKFFKGYGWIPILVQVSSTITPREVLGNCSLRIGRRARSTTQTTRRAPVHDVRSSTTVTRRTSLPFLGLFKKRSADKHQVIVVIKTRVHGNENELTKLE